MDKQLDARGLACPAPVLLVKETLEKQSVTALSVTVDNEAARENVSRFLKSRGFSVNASAQGSDFVLTASRVEGEGTQPESAAVSPAGGAAKKIMVFVPAAVMGTGDDVLGEKLLINYLKTLKEMGPDLWRLVFVNGGVKLTIAGSPALETLQELERNGLLILVCGTCLDHFKLLAAKQVGQTTNMLDIVTAMQLADSVVTVG